MSLADLLGRARALEGRTLGAIAAEHGLSLAGGGVRTKGKPGGAIERALGASGGSAAIVDFPALGVELKTIPVDPRGQPRESTFVCSFSLAEADRAEWASSWARRKLARVLWVPIVTPKGSAIEDRVVGRAVLWSPTPAEESALAADFEEIMGRCGAGRVEALDATTGQCLQARPKAAHGRVRTRAYGPEGEPIDATPRGLYLRPRFTAAILADPGRVPA